MKQIKELEMFVTDNELLHILNNNFTMKERRHIVYVLSNLYEGYYNEPYEAFFFLFRDANRLTETDKDGKPFLTLINSDGKITTKDPDPEQDYLELNELIRFPNDSLAKEGIKSFDYVYQLLCKFVRLAEICMYESFFDSKDATIRLDVLSIERVAFNIVMVVNVLEIDLTLDNKDV